MKTSKEQLEYQRQYREKHREEIRKKRKTDKDVSKYKGQVLRYKDLKIGWSDKKHPECGWFDFSIDMVKGIDYYALIRKFMRSKGYRNIVSVTQYINKLYISITMLYRVCTFEEYVLYVKSLVPQLKTYLFQVAQSYNDTDNQYP